MRILVKCILNTLQRAVIHGSMKINVLCHVVKFLQFLEFHVKQKLHYFRITFLHTVNLYDLCLHDLTNCHAEVCLDK